MCSPKGLHSNVTNIVSGYLPSWNTHIPLLLPLLLPVLLPLLLPLLLPTTTSLL